MVFTWHEYNRLLEASGLARKTNLDRWERALARSDVPQTVGATVRARRPSRDEKTLLPGQGSVNVDQETDHVSEDRRDPEA